MRGPRATVMAMQRRTFLQLMGAASLAPGALGQDSPDLSATVLYGDRATAVAPVRRDPNDPATLWVRSQDLPRINDFELKPEGACRADLCIPVAAEMLRDGYFNLTAFARKVRQAAVADSAARVWSFGEIQAVSGRFLTDRVAPDITIPDRTGRPVRLASFHGKKVL